MKARTGISRIGLSTFVMAAICTLGSCGGENEKGTEEGYDPAVRNAELESLKEQLAPGTGLVAGQITSAGVRGGVRAGQEQGVRAAADRQGDVVPVAGADVYVESNPSLQDTTDSKGLFEILNVPEGNQFIVSTYKDEQGQDGVVRQAAVVIAGNIIELGSLSLQTAGSVRGKICYSDAAKNPDRGCLGIQCAISGTSFIATTDQEGGFTIFFIPPGTYNITCLAPDYDAIAVKSVEVKEQTTTDITDKLGTALEPTVKKGTVKGKAVLEGGSNHAGTTACDETGTLCATTGSDGTYSLDLPVGERDLVFTPATSAGLVIKQMTLKVSGFTAGDSCLAKAEIKFSGAHQKTTLTKNVISEGVTITKDVTLPGLYGLVETSGTVNTAGECSFSVDYYEGLEISEVQLVVPSSNRKCWGIVTEVVRGRVSDTVDVTSTMECVSF